MRHLKKSSIFFGLALFGAALVSRASDSGTLFGRMSLHVGESPSIALPFSILNAGPASVFIKSIRNTSAKEHFIVIGHRDEAAEALGHVLQYRFANELKTPNGPIHIHPDDAHALGKELAKQLSEGANEVLLRPVGDCTPIETFLNTTENAYYSPEQVSRILIAICQEISE